MAPLGSRSWKVLVSRQASPSELPQARRLGLPLNPPPSCSCSLTQPAALPRVQFPVSCEVWFLLSGSRGGTSAYVSTCSVAPHWGLQPPPCCCPCHQEGGCYWSGRSAGLVSQCWEGVKEEGQGRKRAGLAGVAPAQGYQAGPRRLSGGSGLALPAAQVPRAVPERWRAGARRPAQHQARCPSGSCGECGG